MENEQLTDKQKIILVVKESIKFGKKSGFNYFGIHEEHKQFIRTNKFEEKIDNKISLFENLDENSYTFGSILRSAKLALRKLRDDNEYNYYSATLILNIFKLEECFKRKLKPMGVRVLEQKELNNSDVFEKEKVITNKHKQVIEKDEDGNEIQVFEYMELGAKYVGSSVTGERMLKAKKKKLDITNAIKESSFE